MATYDPEEQENIEELKTWWRVYGTQVIVIIAVFIASIAGVQAWNYYQGNRLTRRWNCIIRCYRFRERGCYKISDAAGLVMAGFASSGYASRAALISAQASLDAWRFAKCKKPSAVGAG